MCHTQFENIIYSLVGLDLVGIDDIDGHDLEPSDNPGALINELLVEKYNQGMCHTRFKNVNYPLVKFLDKI